MSTASPPRFRWGSPGTGWETLPAEARELIVASGVRSWAEVQSGVQSFNEQWRPLRPPIMTEAMFSALHDVAGRMLELILAACQRRAATVGELRRAMGVAEGEIALLNEAETLSENLLVAGRPDILLSGGVPKFVEFNIDSALGGALDSDMIATRFAEVYLADGITDRIGLHAPPPAIEGRFRALADWLGPARGDRLAMVMDLAAPHAGLVDPQQFLDKFAPFAAHGAEVAGLALFPYWLQWLRLDEQQRLLAGDEPVPAVFRMFIADKAPDCPGLRALETALLAGTVRMFTSSATWLLSNKLVLAWLWQDLDQLAEADQAVVRAHVPRTLLLDAGLIQDAVTRQQELVLKPGGGSAGIDVLLGRDASPELWRRAVERAVDRGGFLLQDYVESDLLSMDFVDMRTGAVVHQPVPWCFGPYQYGRVPCGGLVRLGFPGGGAVMNIDRGALLSGVAILPSA
ncbi:MAG TPA: hypothetical protein VGX49_11880 [Jatrophihabitans sp.]|jgi:glutathionylspermidine synthase|nr:hypothetical protein [Jatrophihabitans sp.]